MTKIIKSLLIVGVFIMIVSPFKVSSLTKYTPTTDIVTDLGHQTIMHQTVGTFIGPQSINYVSFNPKTTKTIKLIPWAILNAETETNKRSTVLNIAKDYETKNPHSKVIAGINADFFPFVSSNENPFSTQLIEGDLHQGNVFNQNGYISNVLGIMVDGSLQSSYQVSSSIQTYLDIFDESGNVIFTTEVLVNFEPAKGKTSAYFYDYKEALTSDQGIYLIENPSFIKNSYRFARGVISNVSNKINLTNKMIAIKSNDSQVNNLLKKGVEIRITKRIIGDLSDAVSAIGFWGHPLQNGDIVSYGKYPNGAGGPSDTSVIQGTHPRTFLGVKSDHSIIMGIVEGRATNKTGLTGLGVGELLQQFGCVEGYMFDGGGSSTLVARVNNVLKQVATGTSGTREVVNALLLVEQEVDVIELNPTFVDIGVNSFTIKVNPNQEAGITINKIETIVNSKIYTLTNNQYQITNALPNTINTVRFKVTYLENNELKTFTTVKTLLVKTESKPPEIIIDNVDIGSTWISFKVTFRDNGTIINEAYFALNGEKKELVPGINDIVYDELTPGKTQSFTAIVRYLNPDLGAKFYTIPIDNVVTLEKSGCNNGTRYLLNLLSVTLLIIYFRKKIMN